MQASSNGNSGTAANGPPPGGHDDFFDQMLSSLPTAWADLGASKAPWELGGANPSGSSAVVPYDESVVLASRFRQHQINGSGPEGTKTMMLQLNELHHGHQMLLSPTGRSPTGGGGDPGIFPLPLSIGNGGSAYSRLFVDGSRDDVDGPFKSPNAAGGEGLYSGFGGSLAGAAEAVAQTFHHPQLQGGTMAGQGYSGPPANETTFGVAAPPRQRVRARRGQATDPHSIAERLRRERIAERMKALQELVPNANKTDKASMLDEIIDYVKFLQLQVKVLSMSRLGGAAAVAPLVANISSEGQGGGSNNGGTGAGGAVVGEGGGGSSSSSVRVTEQQVAKLMEEDMGSAMQYLQGKGLCLMPISLASAISSTATCLPPRPSSSAPQPLGAPPSPSVSVLTSQSAMTNSADGASKDATSASKP